MHPCRSLARRRPLARPVGRGRGGCGRLRLGRGVGRARGRSWPSGAENEYANVISQIGGTYVRSTAIESNPNTDPHTFEASPSVAQEVGAARLVVQNGVGYDTFMNKIESASPSSSRKVIDVQTLLGLPDSTPNPHLWYMPRTMPAVAQRAGRTCRRSQPAHAALLRRQRAAVRRFAAAVVCRRSSSSQRAIHARRWRPPSRSATTCCKPPAR